MRSYWISDAPGTKRHPGWCWRWLQVAVAGTIGGVDGPTTTTTMIIATAIATTLTTTATAAAAVAQAGRRRS